MNLDFTSAVNGQPLLAVFLTKDNLEEVLADPVFQDGLRQWVQDTDFKAKAGELKRFPSVALRDSGEVTSVAVVGLGEHRDPSPGPNNSLAARPGKRAGTPKRGRHTRGLPHVQVGRTSLFGGASTHLEALDFPHPLKTNLN